MAKVCRKPAVETSSIRLFNLVNSQNHPTHVWDFWKWLIFKRDHKKVTWFFPLDPVTFYGQNVEQQMPGTSYQLFELQYMLTKIPFLVLSFESGNCGKRREKTAKDWINSGKKHFSNFLKCFLLVKYEK